METEIVLIICIMTAVIIIFIAGLLLFVNQLKNRRQLHEKEKAAIEKKLPVAEAANLGVSAAKEILLQGGHPIVEEIRKKGLGSNVEV